jgi:hypothetical protein
MKYYVSKREERKRKKLCFIFKLYNNVEEKTDVINGTKEIMKIF